MTLSEQEAQDYQTALAAYSHLSEIDLANGINEAMENAQNATTPESAAGFRRLAALMRLALPKSRALIDRANIRE